MSEATIQHYCELLSNKIVAMFGVSKSQADRAVAHSAIQKLIREEPEYVDHVPLSAWAEEVHREFLS